MERFCFLYCLIALLSPVYGDSPSSSSLMGEVPREWYELPEDAISLSSLSSSRSLVQKSREPKEPLSMTVEKIYSVTASAMDQLSDLKGSHSIASSRKPEDWVPWHLDSFSTDLSVTAQGLFGVLTIKGTPSVSAIWRKSGARRSTSDVTYLEDRAAPTVEVSAETSEDQLLKQIEPAIQAAVVTGGVRNISKLREGLYSVTRQFQEVLTAIDRSSRSAWYVSGFQFHFSVDAFGNILPIYTAGGGIRLRFAWRRLKHHGVAISSRTRPPSDSSKFSISLMELVSFMETNLDRMSNEYLRNSGFEPLAFGAGIGFSVMGTVGLAVGMASVIGTLNFLKDNSVPRRVPVRQPEPLQTSILVIENNPSRAHLEYAKSNQISIHQASNQAMYRVGSDRFRKGLSKAFQIGSFFAKPATQLKGNRWKVQNLLVNFDLSISGDVAMVSVGGLGTVYAFLTNTRF